MIEPDSIVAAPEDADIETSSDGYAARFAGPAGEWMLHIQETIVTAWLAAQPGASILDVGGGHGQLAIPLSRLGYRVTVCGSNRSCRQRIAAEADAGRIGFEEADLLRLPFADRAFDTVLSIRLLPHCRRWPELVAELCRTARGTVIVDYPTIQSVNAFSFALFGAKKKIERNTRCFTLFRHSEIAREFARHGFRPEARAPQFIFPMVVHRMLNRPRLSALLEAPPRALGLTRLLGSPILVKMKRAAQKSAGRSQ